MIDISDVYKSFGQNHVLKGVNLKVQDGKSMVIIGASGQGKSVILKCLLGLTKPNSGKILLNGFDPDSAQKNIILSKVGMLFQGGALFDSLPIWQNVAFRYLHGKQKINASEARKIAIEKLERVGLKKSFADNFPSELSGGMQKRVAIARAIVNNPSYLFCDEPNSGLDPKTAIVIDNLIKEITEESNITTIINSHDMNSVMEIGEKIIFLKNGALEWNGSKSNIFKTDNQAVTDFVYSSNLYKKVRKMYLEQ